MPVAQLRNADLVSLLSADFQNRLEPNFALANAVSLFAMLPGLRAFWPMSACDNSGAAYDLSGQGRTLSYNGNPTYNMVGLAPYIDFDGVGDYLSRADEAGLDVLGNESYIAAARRGLTVGGWFRFDRDTNGEALVCKSDGALDVNRNWDLLFRGDLAGDPAQFTVSSGANPYTCTGSTDLAISTWYFIAGRFVPSTTVDLYVNDVKATLAAGVPATINNSANDLQIGARNGADLLDGQASLGFLCAAALPDCYLTALYQNTRALFGV